MTVAALVVLASATKTTADYSRVISFGWFVATPVTLTAWRLLMRLVLRALRARGRNIRRVAIVGATASARDLCVNQHARGWGCGSKGSTMIVPTHAAKSCRTSEPRTARQPDRAGDGLPQPAGRHRLHRAAAARRAAHQRDAAASSPTPPRRSTWSPTSSVFDLVARAVEPSATCRSSACSRRPFYGVDGWLKRLEDIVLGTCILALIAAADAGHRDRDQAHLARARCSSGSGATA